MWRDNSLRPLIKMGGEHGGSHRSLKKLTFPHSFWRSHQTKNRLQNLSSHIQILHFIIEIGPEQLLHTPLYEFTELHRLPPPSIDIGPENSFYYDLLEFTCSFHSTMSDHRTRAGKGLSLSTTGRTTLEFSTPATPLGGDRNTKLRLL